MADRRAGQVLGEDTPDDDRFGLEYHQVSRAALASGDAAIPVGDFPEHGLARFHTVKLAPPVAFVDLGLFVFGDHALHLNEETGLGVVVDWGRVGESHGIPKRASSSKMRTW